MSVYFAINVIFCYRKKKENFLKLFFLLIIFKKQPGMALSSSFDLIRNFYNILV